MRGRKIPAHKLTGGVVTLHTAGSFSARFISTDSPTWFGFPNSWHKHTGCVFTKFASSGQQPGSGLVILLPVSTNVRQSARFIRYVKQSTPPGDGAAGSDSDGDIDISGAGTGENCAVAAAKMAATTSE